MSKAPNVATLNLPNAGVLLDLLTPHTMVVQPNALQDTMKCVKVTLAYTEESQSCHLLAEGLSEVAALFTKTNIPKDWVVNHFAPSHIPLPPGAFLGSFVVDLQKLLSALTQGVVDTDAPVTIVFSAESLVIQSALGSERRGFKAVTTLQLEQLPFPKHFHKIYKNAARLWHKSTDVPKHVLFNVGRLTASFKQTVGFAAKDESRPQFCGVRVCVADFDPAKVGIDQPALVISATDGHAVAWSPVGEPADGDAPRSPLEAILAPKAAMTLVQMADAALAVSSDGEDGAPALCWRQFKPDDYDPLIECYLAPGGKSTAGGAAFDQTRAVLYIRPIPGKWPSLSASFAAQGSYTTTLSVHADSLKRAVAAAKAHTQTGILCFRLTHGNLEVFVDSPKGSRHHASLMVVCDTVRELEWKLSMHYLGLVLAAQGKKESAHGMLKITLHTDAEGRTYLPLHFTYDTPSRWLIMPID